MGFMLKMIIMGAIASVIITKLIDAKDKANPEAIIQNIISTTIRGIEKAKQAQKPDTPAKGRVCKIKPNGDEECKDIRIEK